MGRMVSIDVGLEEVDTEALVEELCKRLTLEDRVACQIAFECGYFDTAAEYATNYDHQRAKNYRERARRIIALARKGGVVIGFSVLDGDVARWGGVDPLHREFIARLGRAHTLGHIPSGYVELRHVGRLHEREQWIVFGVRTDMSQALAELVIAWEETEDVDIAYTLRQR